jgi:hypothetical protein
MKLVAAVVALALLLTIPAAAADPLARTFTASIDRVWGVSESVLQHLGWDVDKADRAIGMITTDSRKVEGEDWGVYAKGTRHRLRLTIRSGTDGRTTVTVERTLFKRERILWMDNDETIAATDQNVEKSVLDAIAAAL